LTVIARVEAASRAQDGEELELYLHTDELKLYAPADGRSLTAR
jgi:hypothetical protein